MSEGDPKSNEFDASSPSLVAGWTRSVGQSAEQVRRMLAGPAWLGSEPGGSRGGVAARAWRRQWLDTLGQATEAYLRSPPFLQQLKLHLHSLVRAKCAADVDPAGPLAADIGALRCRLDQLQQQLELLQETAPPWSEPAGATADRSASTAGRGAGALPRGATASDVVHEQGRLRLLRYRNVSVRFAEPILVCFALVNRPYILDLQADRSVVRRLLERGFDVYLIDWGVPAEADRLWRLEDYVCKWLGEMVQRTCDCAGAAQLNLLGYCMGGTMATMFTALEPERVRNLILMAAPIDFAGDQGLLNLWARQDYFDVDQWIDAFGNCPGEFLQFVFQLMKPVQNFAEKQLTICENLHDATFLDSFAAVERWANDSIPVAGETFRQYVKSLYQQNELVGGRMRLAGRLVRLQAIECPLLLLVAEKDHLVPPASTLALQQHAGSTDVESMSIRAGHVGLAVSSTAHRQLWPSAAHWIARHSTEL